MGFFGKAASWVGQRVGQLGSVVRRVARIGGSVAHRVGQFGRVGSHVASAVGNILGAAGVPYAAPIGAAASGVLQGVGGFADKVSRLASDYGGAG
jgi:hypothetical protein